MQQTFHGPIPQAESPLGIWIREICSLFSNTTLFSIINSEMKHTSMAHSTILVLIIILPALVNLMLSISLRMDYFFLQFGLNDPGFTVREWFRLQTRQENIKVCTAISRNHSSQRVHWFSWASCIFFHTKLLFSSTAMSTLKVGHCSETGSGTKFNDEFAVSEFPNNIGYTITTSNDLPLQYSPVTATVRRRTCLPKSPENTNLRNHNFHWKTLWKQNKYAPMTKKAFKSVSSQRSQPPQE